MTRIHLKTRNEFPKNRKSPQEEDREVVRATEDVALAREKENDLESEKDQGLVSKARNLDRVQDHARGLLRRRITNIKAMVSSKKGTTLDRSSRHHQKNTSRNLRVNINRMVSDSLIDSD